MQAETAPILTPGDKVGEEAFAVIWEAMRATDRVGISRLVLYRRERTVLIEPRGEGMILWTLRYGGEASDPVQDRLAEIIEAKKQPAKKGAGKNARPEPATNVIDVMNALRKSLGEARRPPSGKPSPGEPLSGRPRGAPVSASTNSRRTRWPDAALIMRKATRSEVDAAVNSATCAVSSATLRTPFQFARGAITGPPTS